MSYVSDPVILLRPVFSRCVCGEKVGIFVFSIFPKPLTCPVSWVGGSGEIEREDWID